MKNRPCNTCRFSLSCPLAFRTEKDVKAEMFKKEIVGENHPRAYGRGGAMFRMATCYWCNTRQLLVSNADATGERSAIPANGCGLRLLPAVWLPFVCCSCQEKNYGNDQTTKGGT
jgi:hypothetical protein